MRTWGQGSNVAIVPWQEIQLRQSKSLISAPWLQSLWCIWICEYLWDSIYLSFNLGQQILVPCSVRVSGTRNRASSLCCKYGRRRFGPNRAVRRMLLGQFRIVLSERSGNLDCRFLKWGGSISTEIRWGNYTNLSGKYRRFACEQAVSLLSNQQCWPTKHPKHTRFLCCIGQIHAASTLRILQVSLAWSQWVVLEALLRASRTWVFGIDIKHQDLLRSFRFAPVSDGCSGTNMQLMNEYEWIMSLSITFPKQQKVSTCTSDLEDVLPREGLRSGDVLYEKSCIQLLGQSFSEALGLGLTLAA